MQNNLFSCTSQIQSDRLDFQINLISKNSISLCVMGARGGQQVFDNRKRCQRDLKSRSKLFSGAEREQTENSKVLPSASSFRSRPVN